MYKRFVILATFVFVFLGLPKAVLGFGYQLKNYVVLNLYVYSLGEYTRLKEMAGVRFSIIWRRYVFKVYDGGSYMMAEVNSSVG